MFFDEKVVNALGITIRIVFRENLATILQTHCPGHQVEPLFA